MIKTFLHGHFQKWVWPVWSRDPIKLIVSQKWTDGINWMFSCWCKFRKAKSWFNDFWVGVFKNGHDLFSATNNGQWPIITTHFLCFTGYLSPIYWQVYLIQFVDQLYLKQLLNFLYAKRRFSPGKEKRNIAYFLKTTFQIHCFDTFIFASSRAA